MSFRLVLSGVVLTGAALSGTALAQEVCDPYSENCDLEPTCEVQESSTTSRTVTDPYSGQAVTETTTTDGCDTAIERTSTPSSLPFTGGELVTLTALGLGALAGGTALVVAGRRKAVRPTA